MGTRLLLPSSAWGTLLGVNQGTCGASILIQYAGQPRETVDRDLLFWPSLNVVRNDLEGCLRRLLVVNGATEYRKDNGPLGLRAKMDQPNFCLGR